MKKTRIILYCAGVVFVCLVTARALLRTPSLPVPPADNISLLNVTLIQPGVFRRENVDIQIRAGRIASIEPSVSQAERKTGAGGRVARGGFVLPGLIDMHVHYPPAAAPGQQSLWSLLFLAHGVTTVREIGSIDGSTYDLREEIKSGKSIGPNLYTCGRILDGRDKVFPSNFSLRDASETAAVIALKKKRRADCVKLYTMLSRAQVHSITGEARKHGLKILGHLPHSVDLADAGIPEIQHLMGFPPVDKSLVGKDESRLEDWAALGEERIRRRVRLSRKLNIAHVPNLINARMRLMMLDERAWNKDTGLRHLPRFWALAWNKMWGPPYKPGREQLHRLWRRKMKRITRDLVRAGVPVYAGSDTLMPYVAPGSSLHGELEEMMHAGLTPEQALAAATTIPGGWFREPSRGFVRVGAPADLLLLGKDPLRDKLKSLKRPRAVIAAGRFYDSEYFARALKIYDEHFLSGFYKIFMNGFARILISRFSR